MKLIKNEGEGGKFDEFKTKISKIRKFKKKKKIAKKSIKFQKGSSEQPPMCRYKNHFHSIN